MFNLVNKSNKFLKILFCFFGLTILLWPTLALAVKDPTVTAKDDTVTITIYSSPTEPLPADPGSSIEIKRDGTNIPVDGTIDADGNFVITDKPDKDGSHTYTVTIGSKTTTRTVRVSGTSGSSSGIIPDLKDKDPTLDDIQQLIVNIGNLALTLVGGVAVIYIIIGAYHYFLAFGNEEQATTGKKTITWAFVGLVVIILAKVILTQVWTFITDTSINFWF